MPTTKRHKHKWDSGSVVWKAGKPKIKTTCLVCKKDIIVEFGDDARFAEPLKEKNDSK